ncbi:unnamed protein product [Mortierella alpina]
MNASTLDNGEGCSTKVTPAVCNTVHSDPPSGQETAVANAQKLARVVSNFEDVFGEESRYNSYDSESSIINTDGDEDDDGTLRSTEVASVSVARRNTRKRKSPAPGLEDGDDSNDQAKRQEA